MLFEGALGQVSGSLKKLRESRPDDEMHLPGVETVAEALLGLEMGFGVGAGCCRSMAEDGMAFNVSAAADGSLSHAEVDLKLDAHSLSKSLLCGGGSCGCLACEDGLSRAYVSHLVKNGEMMGKISLMQHNLWQLCAAAEAAGKRIK